MRNCMKSVLALFCLTFAVQFTSSNAFASSTPSFSCGTKKLTPAQCVIVRKALADYITIIKKLLGNSPLANALITLAQKDTDKVCPLPPPPPDNGYTPDTTYECAVLDSTANFAVTLSLDAGGNFTNVINTPKAVCMSQPACLSLVPSKYVVLNSTVTSRCQDPNDTTVQHLTDAEVSSKLSAVP